MKPALFTSIALFVSLAGTACRETTVCDVAASARVVPSDTTIHLGQTFTVVFQGSNPCSRDNPWTTVLMHWTTLDTNIISLDTLTGLVTGRAIGDAHVVPGNNDQTLTATVHVR